MTDKPDYDFPSKQGIVATFSLRPDDDWDHRVEINKDGYSRRIITFAADAAQLAEQLLDEDPTRPFEQVIDEALKAADYDGITGFMYGAAISELSRNWKFGDQLKAWHNAQYGVKDAQGVVNPAILTIGTKE